MYLAEVQGKWINKVKVNLQINIRQRLVWKVKWLLMAVLK